MTSSPLSSPAAPASLEFDQVFAGAEFRAGPGGGRLPTASQPRSGRRRTRFFTNALESGQTDQQITALMAASDDFFARLQ